MGSRKTKPARKAATKPAKAATESPPWALYAEKPDQSGYDVISGRTIESATTSGDAVVAQFNGELADEGSALCQILAADEEMGDIALALMVDLRSVGVCALSDRELLHTLATEQTLRVQRLNGVVGEKNAFISELEVTAKKAKTATDKAVKAAAAKALGEFEDELRRAVNAGRSTNVIALVKRYKTAQDQFAGEKGGLLRDLQTRDDRIAELEGLLAAEEGSMVLNPSQAQQMRLTACFLGGLGGKLKDTLGAAKTVEYIRGGVSDLSGNVKALTAKLAKSEAELTAATAATASPAVPVAPVEFKAAKAEFKAAKAEFKAALAKSEAKLKAATAATASPAVPVDNALIAELEARIDKLEGKLVKRKAKSKASKASIAELEEKLYVLSGRSAVSKAERMFEVAGMTVRDEVLALWGGVKVGLIGEVKGPVEYRKIKVMAPVAIVYRLHAGADPNVIVAQSVRSITEDVVVIDQYTEPGESISGITLDFKSGGEILSVLANLGVHYLGPDAADAPNYDIAQAVAWTQKLATKPDELCKATHNFTIDGERVALTNAPMLTIIGRRQRLQAENAARTLLS